MKLWQKVKYFFSWKLSPEEEAYYLNAWRIGELRRKAAVDVLKYNPDLYARISNEPDAFEIRRMLHEEYGVLLTDDSTPHDWSRLLNLIEQKRNDSPTS